MTELESKLLQVHIILVPLEKKDVQFFKFLHFKYFFKELIRSAEVFFPKLKYSGIWFVFISESTLVDLILQHDSEQTAVKLRSPTV